MSMLDSIKDSVLTTPVLAVAPLTLLALWWVQHNKSSKQPLPPLVPYTNPILGSTMDYLNAPHEWLNHNFDKYGPVIRARLFGRVQYIVDAPLVPEAMKHKNFNSEKGANAIQFLDVLVGLAEQYHMEDTHHLVLKALNNKMDIFVDRVRPHFSRIIKSTIGSDGPKRVDDPFAMIRGIIAQAMSESFVGEELGSDPEILHVFTNVTEVVAALATAGASSLVGMIIPGWRRLLATYMVKIRGVLRPYTSILQRHIAPEMLRRVSLRQACGTNEAEWEDRKPVDILQTILDERNVDLTSKDAALARLDEVINLLLFLIFASVHLTSVHLTWVVNSLAAHPECHPTLLTELHTVLAARGGVLDDEALRMMPMLDSFMRETFRTRFDCIGGSQRVAEQDTLLDGGYLIQKGALINPITFRSHQSTTLQPTDREPLGFHPWVHTEPSSRTSPAYLQFGLGRHACPGRFLAVSEAKLLVSYLLGQYDVQFAEPEKGVQIAMKAFTFSMPPTSPMVFTPKNGKEIAQLE